jgi:hypothetical protein
MPHPPLYSRIHLECDTIEPHPFSKREADVRPLRLRLPSGEHHDQELKPRDFMLATVPLCHSNRSPRSVIGGSLPVENGENHKLWTPPHPLVSRFSKSYRRAGEGMNEDGVLSNAARNSP